MSYYEDYVAFQNRIFSFEKPNFCFGADKLVPSNSAKEKVDSSGGYRFFIGDTVVFNLEDSVKDLIQCQYVDPLYRVSGRCFSEKFHKKMLHMTLHDLNASAHYNEEILKKMCETEFALSEKLERLSVENETINMETICVFNMVNTSLVLGLKPKSKFDYDILMSLYMLVDELCPLPYQLTPHITLAYYGNNELNSYELREIESCVNSLNSLHFDIPLSMRQLYYQKFVNMNKYFNIMPFVR